MKQIVQDLKTVETIFERVICAKGNQGLIGKAEIVCESYTWVEMIERFI